MKGKVMPDAHKLKISLAHKDRVPLAANISRRKKVWVYDIHYNLVNNGPFYL
jgi:hypothetical protein